MADSATERVEWERVIAGPMICWGIGSRVWWVLDRRNCLSLIDTESRLVYRRVETYVAEGAR